MFCCAVLRCAVLHLPVGHCITHCMPALAGWESFVLCTGAALTLHPLPLLAPSATAAHEASERPVAALQTNLIAATSHAEERREWFYYSQPPPQGQGGGGESRLGPVSKAEIRQLLRWAWGGHVLCLLWPAWVGETQRSKGRLLCRPAPDAHPPDLNLSPRAATLHLPPAAARAPQPLPLSSGRLACLSRYPWGPSASCGGGWHTAWAHSLPLRQQAPRCACYRLLQISSQQVRTLPAARWPAKCAAGCLGASMQRQGSSTCLRPPPVRSSGSAAPPCRQGTASYTATVAHQSVLPAPCSGPCRRCAAPLAPGTPPDGIKHLPAAHRAAGAHGRACAGGGGMHAAADRAAPQRR